MSSLSLPPACRHTDVRTSEDLALVYAARGLRAMMHTIPTYHRLAEPYVQHKNEHDLLNDVDVVANTASNR